MRTALVLLGHGGPQHRASWTFHGRVTEVRTFSGEVSTLFSNLRIVYFVARAMEGKRECRTLFMLPSLDPPRKPNPPPGYLGILLIIAGVTCVGLCLYTVVSKMYIVAGRPAADMMRRDWYYATLFPLTLPVTVVAVYLHWLSMKLFKHA